MSVPNLGPALDLNYGAAAESMYRMVAAAPSVQPMLDAAEIDEHELLMVILFVMAQGGVRGPELMQAVNMYKYGKQRVTSIEAKEVDEDEPSDDDARTEG